VTHNMTMAIHGDSIEAICSCGAGTESQGLDESSRLSVDAWMKSHRAQAVAA